ncbi:MAG: hypothetical protein ACM3U1_09175 [Chloroflexota bacterium]
MERNKLGAFARHSYGDRGNDKISRGFAAAGMWLVACYSIDMRILRIRPERYSISISALFKALYVI